MDQLEAERVRAFEIRETTSDVLRIYALLLGPALPMVLLMGVGLIVRGVVGISEGTAPEGPVALLFFAMGLFVWSIVHRVRQQVRYNVRITSEHLILYQSEAHVRLSWSSITKVEEDLGILSITGNARVALPWYRMSVGQRESIESQLPPSTFSSPPKRKGRSIEGIALIVIAVLAFIALYNTFGGR